MERGLSSNEPISNIQRVDNRTNQIIFGASFRTIIEYDKEGNLNFLY
jgi:hypothetical protein